MGANLSIDFQSLQTLTFIVASIDIVLSIEHCIVNDSKETYEIKKYKCY